MDNISEGKLINVLKCIQYFFVCYNLISMETSNKISEGIQKYASLIENKYRNDVLKQFLQHLKNRMPSKEEFQDTFKLIGYSNHCEYYHDGKNKQRVEMVLIYWSKLNQSVWRYHNLQLSIYVLIHSTVSMQ